MKKIYKTPNTKVVKTMIKANLLAGSGGLNDGDPVGNSIPVVDNSGNNFAKGWGGWYDFEDEEDF